MKHFVSLFIFLSFGVISAQDNILIDSLKTVIKTSSSDSVKMVAFNKLRRATYYSDAASSKIYTENYLESAEKIKDSHNIILARFFLGNASLMSGDYDNAVEDYLIAANYYERKKDSARLTSVLNSLGALYEKTEQDSLSLKYYLKARELGKSLKDLRRSGIASVNIGNIYIAQKKLDSASIFINDAIEDLSIDPAHQSFLIIAETNLANIYGKKKQYEDGLKLYDKILRNIDTVSDTYNYANVLRGKSNMYAEQKKYKLALPLLEKAYKKYTDNNFGDERFQAMPELIDIYKNTDRNAEAVALFEEYVTIKDSILYSEQEKNIADAVTKYETEKKDAQLKVFELEKEQSKQRQLFLTVLSISGLLIAALIGFFLYRNKKQNTRLAKQKLMLEKTVDEKNVLLKETHHRVKNSFQMVSSLLFYQSQTAKDKEAKIAIKEAQNRVRSMVLIHQKLYSKEQLVGIDSKEYITDFTEDVIRSHEFNDHKLNYELNLESHILDIETITPIGLILNELLTNVLKHAFPIVTNESNVIITFVKTEDTLVLSLSDNGIGMSEATPKDSFGLKLIETLAKKLKGDLILEKNSPSGITATLTMRRFSIL